mgnify:FL=1
MKLSNKFVLREIAGDSILIPIGQTDVQGMLLLNPVSMLIYQGLQNGNEPEEILQQIITEYDVEKTQAQDNLKETLAQMQELGIIVA